LLSKKRLQLAIQHERVHVTLSGAISDDTQRCLKIIETTACLRFSSLTYDLLLTHLRLGLKYVFVVKAAAAAARDRN
jgi:hypothetical protein